MTPNQRDPDLVQIIDNLQTRLAALEANTVSRWGRVPHVAADPATLADGQVWLRSDDKTMRYRANSTTGIVGARSPWGIQGAPVVATANSTNVGGTQTLLSATPFTTPGGRYHRITGSVPEYAKAAGGSDQLQIYLGATQIASVDLGVARAAGSFEGTTIVAWNAPAAGTVTYALCLFTSSANAFAVHTNATNTFYIFVEDMGPV